jgi:Leucine-rich repeat (LRR) protein
MSTHATPTPPASGRRNGLLIVTVVLLLAGCDKLQGPSKDDEPEPVPVVASPPPIDVTPVVVRTPEQLIDGFLAVLPSLRTDDQLLELSELEEGLDRITELDLRQSAVTDNGVAVLPKFAAVTRLDLSGSRVSGAVTQYLAEMPALEELSLNGVPLEDAALAPLSRLPALRTLSLSTTAVSDDCFPHLAACKSLESLTLDGNDRLLGTRFSELLWHREFPSLRELSVNHTGFGNHGLDELNRLPHLEVLSASNAEVTSLDIIGSCTSLRSLNLSDNRLTDAVLPQLRRLKDLEELDLSACPAITDAGLLHLRGHKQLRRLSLEGTHCSLAGATDLKQKYLENTTIRIANQEL